MSQRNNQERSRLLTSSHAKSVNKKLDRLGMEPVRSGVEAQLATAAWKSHDAGLGHTLIATIFAGIALMVALANSQAGSGDANSQAGSGDAIPVAILVVVVFIAIAILVLQDRRNWESARVVLDYRVEHDLLPAADVDE